MCLKFKHPNACLNDVVVIYHEKISKNRYLTIALCTVLSLLYSNMELALKTSTI